jgi:tRNA U34 5-methylaminomethyl-2-thiouridine-forming methyltransferase MnmC
MFHETIVECIDGSNTLISERFNEMYHSKYGSIQESERVFIDIGYNKAIEGKKVLAVLEVGFGTGLNTLLTYFEKKEYTEVFYTALEKFPISISAAEKLNFTNILNKKYPYFENAIFLDMHTAKWNEWIDFEKFHLLKLEADLLAVDLQTNCYDLVYFDAFAPEAQPEMWSIEVFTKIYNSLKIGGILTTYCAKGVVKRNLKSVGFSIEALAGPIGKREITRATK